ncbi:MAG: hypothetical protein NW220_16885 [Leptolyngbyaceae cyanobacterium bins.349]|nr:hypothetical protein [Leptolyngbyaceae cyanobacterium bins.349]
MKNTSFAVFIKPFQQAVPGSAIAHLKAGLDVRDLEYLTVNPHRSRPETLAQFHQRTTGTPYTGKYGHISIE